MLTIFVQAARQALRQAFARDDYLTQRAAVVRDFEQRRAQILSAVEQQTQALGFGIRPNR